MKKNVWRMLDDEKKSFPEDFGTPLPEDMVLYLEKSISIPLNNQYKYFLENYGCVLLPGYVIFGLENLWGDGDVLQNTRFYKDDQGWPGIDDWYIISDDGFGNPIGIKPDGSVWLSDHDCGFKQVKLADDFEGFLYKALTETMFEEETEE